MLPLGSQTAAVPPLLETCTRSLFPIEATDVDLHRSRLVTLIQKQAAVPTDGRRNLVVGRAHDSERIATFTRDTPDICRSAVISHAADVCRSRRATIRRDRRGPLARSPWTRTGGGALVRSAGTTISGPDPVLNVNNDTSCPLGSRMPEPRAVIRAISAATQSCCSSGPPQSPDRVVRDTARLLSSRELSSGLRGVPSAVPEARRP
jgi:hypothetical protein